MHWVIEQLLFYHVVFRFQQLSFLTLLVKLCCLKIGVVLVYLPISIFYGVVCGCEYPFGSLLMIWIYEQIGWLYDPNCLPNSMLLNLFWTTWILDSCSCGWSINILATFYNSTCLTMSALMWEGTKGKSMIACPSLQNAQTFENNLIISKSTYSWSGVSIMYLSDPTLDSLDVNMIVVLHPTHSPMPLHTQMILGNFP
jgi:hypothetical protein